MTRSRDTGTISFVVRYWISNRPEPGNLPAAGGEHHCVKVALVGLAWGTSCTNAAEHETVTGFFHFVNGQRDRVTVKLQFQHLAKVDTYPLASERLFQNSIGRGSVERFQRMVMGPNFMPCGFELGGECGGFNGRCLTSHPAKNTIDDAMEAHIAIVLATAAQPEHNLIEVAAWAPQKELNVPGHRAAHSAREGRDDRPQVP